MVKNVLTRQKKLKYRIFSVFIITAFIACSENKNDAEADIKKTESVDAGQRNLSTHIFSVKTFRIDNGWGYDIYIDSTRHIHQEHIPAINGVHAFASENDAKKVAELMVSKLQKNMLQPTVSVAELEVLGIKINY